MTIPNEYWDYVDDIGDLKSSEKSLLSFLCRKANPKKNWASWYSVAEMARRLCMSEKSAKNGTKELSNRGLIEKYRRKDSSSVYVVNLPEIKRQAVNNPNGKGNYCPYEGQLLPEGGEIIAHKNEIENEIENVITGGQTAAHFGPNINSKILTYYHSIKLFVAQRHNRLLPKEPSWEDVEAIEWAVEFFNLEFDGIETRKVCEFAIQELGEPEKILNPLVRLKMAYDETGNDQRFTYKFDEFLE